MVLGRFITEMGLGWGMLPRPWAGHVSGGSVLLALAGSGGAQHTPGWLQPGKKGENFQERPVGGSPDWEGVPEGPGAGSEVFSAFQTSGSSWGWWGRRGLALLSRFTWVILALIALSKVICLEREE